MALILMIDDDGLYRGIIERTLADHGHAVVTAENGAAGIALYRELSPDLVITDMRMPKVDGAEVIRSIRADDVRTKIVAVSGSTTFQSVDFYKLAKEIGADAVVCKIDPMETVIVEVQVLLKVNARLTSGPSIFRAAKLLLDRHGENALLRAAERTNQLLDAGDMIGAATWQRILGAVEELTRGRRDGEAVN
jgi:DNA-binding response OmpR family regulator